MLQALAVRHERTGMKIVEQRLVHQRHALTLDDNQTRLLQVLNCARKPVEDCDWRSELLALVHGFD